jgi:hypothetical protein
MEMARRLSALIALQTSLDANYREMIQETQGKPGSREVGNFLQ